MRAFVAGAGGAIGRPLVRALVREGCDVVAMTRSAGKSDALRLDGAEPVVADALDASAVDDAVAGVRPDVVIHQLTAIPARLNVRRIDRDFALTNRLRTEGTDHLIAAARAAGARRFVAQSFTGWPYAREGGPVKDEADPLDSSPPARLAPILEAIRHHEAAVVGAEGLEGVVLRYGALYGPGTSFSQSGTVAQDVRRRRFPLVGDAGGVWSFVHVEDAAEATVAAIERGAPGIYNIVDDEPAAVSDWLPALAAALGAKPPRRVPAFIGRLAVGEHGVAMMTDVRGASNAKAKRDLGWKPKHPSWREGFKDALGP